MPDRSELGKRIKKVREDRHMTLKNIEAVAAISATHISEIERGKTSPTLGALMRIARALDKAPAYFIEEEDLGESSLVTLENRLQETIAGGSQERLTSSIPGGRLQARSITLNGGSAPWQPQSHDGNEAVLVLAGTIVVRVGDEQHELKAGDAASFIAEKSHGYANPSRTDPATMLWVCTRRHIN